MHACRGRLCWEMPSRCGDMLAGLSAHTLDKYESTQPAPRARADIACENIRKCVRTGIRSPCLIAEEAFHPNKKLLPLTTRIPWEQRLRLPCGCSAAARNRTRCTLRCPHALVGVAPPPPSHGGVDDRDDDLFNPPPPVPAATSDRASASSASASDSNAAIVPPF